MGEFTFLNVRMSVDLRERVNKMAKAKEQSSSAIVRNFLIDEVNRFEQIEKMKGGA